ncbi:hypothetical protein [Rhizobium leguminosarum]|uniref:hypothetical protein n=1 Tax=Rhizobium leguminosarum TaxID=384 RepID=UPI002E0F8D0B|nr:hypothetical protein U8Q02_40665 [Rhizobium leguminosarum]
MTTTGTTQDAWQKKMAVRQNPAQFDMARLLGSLLTDHWMHECEILPAYVPPRADAGTRPECRVRYVREDGQIYFLRYSRGPLQGYFWDAYGEDMHYPELAVVAISRSPAPPGVSVIPTHGR